MSVKLQSSAENKRYIAVVSVLVIALLVFFSSKYWLFDDSAIAQTEFNEDINELSETTLTLRKWEYNPKNEQMEVTLEKEHSGETSLDPTLDYKAKLKNANDEYKVEKKYDDNGTIVLHIEGIPEDFHQVGLFVTEHRDARGNNHNNRNSVDDDDDYQEENNASDDEEAKNETSETTIVGDYREINVNHELEDKTDKDYEREALEDELERIEDDMNTIIDEDIPVQEDVVSDLEEEKQDMKDELSYKTEDEQATTENDIQNKEEEIQNEKEGIDELKDELEQVHEKYEKRKEKLENMNNNHQRKPMDELEREKRKQENKEKMEQDNERNTDNNDDNN